MWAEFILGGQRVSLVVVVVAIAGKFLRVIQIHDEPDFLAEIIVKTDFAFFKHALHRPAEIIGDVQNRGLLNRY